VQQPVVQTARARSTSGVLQEERLLADLRRLVGSDN